MNTATEEKNEIRSLARQFALEQLRPHTERWDHDARVDEAVRAQLAELGFFGMRAPEAHGGMGFALPVYLAALEEIAWGEPAVAMTLAASDTVAALLLRHGSDAQRLAWLERMAAGEIVGAVAVAEDEAGADVQAITTTARRDGDGWRLSGEKRWVTNGSSAGLVLVLARAGDGAPGLFLVPTDVQGWTVVRREVTLGLRPLELVTVRLDDVRVGMDALLGDARAGASALDSVAADARLGIAAVAVGIARAALEHARGYAAERQQFGQPLRAFQGIQFKLADMALRTAAASALLGVAAESGESGVAEMAKVFASETAMWVTTQAVQIFGGYGYMRDYPVEKLMRDAKAMEIVEGTNDVLRVRIAESLYET